MWSECFSEPHITRHSDKTNSYFSVIPYVWMECDREGTELSKVTPNLHCSHLGLIYSQGMHTGVAFQPDWGSQVKATLKAITWRARGLHRGNMGSWFGECVYPHAGLIKPLISTPVSEALRVQFCLRTFAQGSAMVPQWKSPAPRRRLGPFAPALLLGLSSYWQCASTRDRQRRQEKTASLWLNVCQTWCLMFVLNHDVIPIPNFIRIFIWNMSWPPLDRHESPSRAQNPQSHFHLHC